MNIGKNRKAWLKDLREDFAYLRTSLGNVYTWVGWLIGDCWRFALGKEKW